MTIRSFINCGICWLAATCAVPAQTAIEPIPEFKPVAAADGKLGSTMTFEELQTSKGRTRRQQDSTPISVQPATEPVPALRIRFYPELWDLKPGQALLHYTRAQMLFSQHKREDQNRWQSSEWLEGTGDGEIPTTEQIKAAIDGLRPVFDELHELAIAEDFRWDHRLRDIRGPQVYMYLLPDVQEIRTMARMLVLKTRYQLSVGEFDGAFSSITDGLRLAAFVGQGETLIQRLVGIAITSMMRDQITNAISQPGCPNLYWALATIPRPLIEISDSVLWELNNIPKVLPVLVDAETEIWTEAEASRKWSAALEDLGILSGSGSVDDGDLRITLAISSVAFVDRARDQLLARGYTKEKLEQLPGLQVILIEAAQELQRVGDDLGKAHLLPSDVAKPLLTKQDEKFQNWLRKNRLSSVSAAIGGILYPAVAQAKEAETRTLMTYNRLMTLEAIRMHAAGHNGNLPDSLADLDPVPALNDPYTGKPFGYDIEVIKGKKTVTLTAAGPVSYKPLQTLKATFSK